MVHQYIYNKLILGGLISTLGDVFFKRWTLTNSTFEYYFGYLLYILAIYFLVSTFKEKNITTGVVIYILVNISSFAIINSLCFNDNLSPLQIFAVVLAGCSIYLLEYK